MAKETPPNLVGALHNGLRILRYLAATNEAVGVTRIARDLNLNPSTCFNLLKTLAHENLISFDSDNKTYAVALGLIELTRGILEKREYIRLIHPTLAEIAEHYGVTATLWHTTGKERVVLVDRADADSSVRVHMNIGQRLPMYIAALGRCMAAHSSLTAAQLRQHFDRLRWARQPDFDDYLDSVEQARAQGYAIDNGTYVKGVSTVSAAILDSAGVPVMAISAVGFSGQLSTPQMRELGQDLNRRAQTISTTLMGRRPAV